MLPRNLLLPAALATAVGIPLIAFSPNPPSANVNHSIASLGVENALSDPNDPLGNGEMLFVPVGNLREIIRFDVYPNWVKSRWPRVSTAPSADGLQGMRVALVTGSNAWDISGALTYYFDQNQRVQRVSILGETGDAGQLVRFLTDNYQFKIHQTQAAGLFTAGSRRRIHGVLKLENPIVINAADPLHQVRVIFELNRPEGDLSLSQTTASLIQSTPY
jgi:hypothetical protein